MDFLVENEISLSTEYIKSRDLIPDGSVFVRADEAAGEYLKESLGRFGVLAKNRNRARQLWYVVRSSLFSAEKLRLMISEGPIKSDFPILLVILLDNIPESGSVRRFSEMELISADDELIRIRESILSLHMKNVKAVFCDRLFGAEFISESDDSVIAEAINDRTVTVSQNDANRAYSYLYIPDLINAVFTVSKYGDPGNVYNASSRQTDRYTFKSNIYRLLSPFSITLTASNDEKRPRTYSALSAGKLASLGFESVCSEEDAIRYTFTDRLKDFPLLQESLDSQYDGKLSALRSLQLEMLREFDRICRMRNIKYFLSGGSMLGAVRHNGYIPWDDDIDVAMLRSEYNKFCEAVRDELSDKFLYLNYKTCEGYHFFFDRITAKNTYFATKYSDEYDMPKGISVDIFVFDNAPKNSKRFWNSLMRKRLVMNVRWKNRPRKGRMYILSKLLLPILRLKSMDSYSSSYDKATRKYENTDTGYVLPPATDHVFKGSMPKRWFEDVVPAVFEGIDTFIPKGYNEYLKIWYGEDYMKPLPLYRQRSYHDYYRLDTGCSGEAPIDFDRRGEIYEKGGDEK